MLAFSTPSWKKQPQVLSNPKVTVATLRSRAACASEIVPRVYVSDYSTATDAKALVKLGVTHVVTCMEDAPGEKNLKVKVSVGGKEQERVIKRLHVPVSDLPSVDLACWFSETTAWITQALEEDEHNVVLVHCLMVCSPQLQSHSPC
jgi:atypical dual specificity phosphatase